MKTQPDVFVYYQYLLAEDGYDCHITGPVSAIVRRLQPTENDHAVLVLLPFGALAWLASVADGAEDGRRGPASRSPSPKRKE